MRRWAAVSTPGGTRINSCFVIDSPQALLNCDTTIPFKAHHNAKIFGSFPFPGDISVSGTFQSVAGATYNADYRVPNDLISESLGRNLAACGTQTVCSTTTAVPLIAPYSAFLDRKNQLDLRVSKAITVGGVEFRGNLDLYNVTNGAPVLGGQLQVRFLVAQTGWTTDLGGCRCDSAGPTAPLQRFADVLRGNEAVTRKSTRSFREPR